jgi:ABC-2 type transport system ATP-binding protein
MTAAISAEGLVKTYGKVRALDGVDLAVEEGTVLGLLGPNGAGKTTCVRILSTLLRPDAGRASVGGIDVLARPDAVRRIMGLSGQNAAVDENLTGRENLTMFGRLYHLGAREAKRRAAELLDDFELNDSGDRVVKTYSGGMRRRLDLAGALVARPRILFLDEPTTGLDPRSRIGMWEVINRLVKEGATVLLTTQYLEEADQLADRISVVDHGRVIAEGTSDQLKDQLGGERLELVLADGSRVEEVRRFLGEVGSGEVVVDAHARQLSAPVSGGTGALVELLRRLDSAGIEVQDIGVRRPTLDDVFLSLTGHAAGFDESSDSGGNDRPGSPGSAGGVKEGVSA